MRFEGIYSNIELRLTIGPTIGSTIGPKVIVCYIETEYHHKYGSNPCIEAKHEKVSVVVVSDTIVKPRAVVVHL